MRSDPDTKTMITKFIINTERIPKKKQKLMKMLARYYDGATISNAEGIYKMKNGKIIFEKSWEIKIATSQLFNNTETIDRLCRDIKILLSQESVMVEELKIPDNQVRFI